MIHEHHIQVNRTARYFTLGDSSQPPGEIWFVCHGYGQLASSFIRRFENLAGGRRLVVAPEGLSRFYLEDPEGGHARARVGATWMTREDRLNEIDDYVRYLDLVYGAALGRADPGTKRIVALGFSQGVATVCRWATHGDARVNQLILWGDRLPPDLDLAAARAALQGVDIVFVVGAHDQYWSPDTVSREAGRLQGVGIAYRVVTFEGGHELNPAVLASLAAPTSS